MPLASIATLAVAGILVAGCGASSPPAVSNAARLADIGGHPGAANEIQAHLSSLDSKCTEDEAAIAGSIDFAYKDLRKYDVGEPMTAVAANIDKSVPPLGRVSCQGVVAAFLVLTEPGG